MLLRLLELARRTGVRLHFFASERTLRAFPTEADAVLNDGHDLDYLAKHPEDPSRWKEAHRLFQIAGHEVRGWAVREPWDERWTIPPGIDLLSGPEGGDPPLRRFPVTGRTLHEAVRAGIGFRSWIEDLWPELERVGGTVVFSPQVLARVDPKLTLLEEALRRAGSVGLPIRTLREAV